MTETFVGPIAATTTDSSVKALSYVALRSHDGKRIILPVAAAASSRLLHGLLQGLCVMQLYESAADDAGVHSNTSIPTTNTEAEERTQHAEEDEGAAYRSYATGFPVHKICQPPPAPSPRGIAGASGTTSNALLASSTTPSPTHLLEVPMRSLETSTLARVVEFLVVKCTLACHPHYLHETDVFSDLDRTSERDQLTAMQVLLGADFLNC